MTPDELQHVLRQSRESGLRPDLRKVDLSGADLSGADLCGALGLNIVEDAPARLLAVAHAALASPHSLEMSDWHTCKTKHCISGWAEHLGGPLAKLIIEQFGNDVGGLMLLGVEAHAHFYKENDDARAFLQSVINQANASQEASSTIMPDDAPELAGNLVGTMLPVGETGEITGDGTGEALPDMDRPLWKAMDSAYFVDFEIGHCGRLGYAAEIEALRDWIFLRTCHTAHALEVRDLLTEQARIARGES